MLKRKQQHSEPENILSLIPPSFAVGKKAIGNGEALDRVYHAAIGQMTTGFSPAAMVLAYTDWIAHLSFAPHRQRDLLQEAGKKAIDLSRNALRYFSGDKNAFNTEDLRLQRRFQHPGWQSWPYNILAQNFLNTESFWQAASRVRGMSTHDQDFVSFMNLLSISALSPENFPLTNPEILEKTQDENGMNFVNGWSNLIEDSRRLQNKELPVESDGFKPGVDVAVTEGKVVFKNKMFELIQYSPKTATTYPEPILIIPAWIMKYYILDLSPKNSMVKYLVEQGHTVFMISWKNPDASYRDVDFEAYLKDGALEAFREVQKIIPGHQVHAVGYCIGGTLLTMLAAYLQGAENNALKTTTLFAAQVDFTEAGKLMTFIDQSQLSYLEDIMFSQGFLRGDQISASFELLKPRELIWPRIVQNYLLGERDKPSDLMAWDQDATRLPYRMHFEYLKDLYLDNQLAEGEFDVDGEVLDLDNIKTPMFVVGNERDDIAPWKSVYKIHLHTDAEITFVLTNKGHNSGIVNEPGHEGRQYRTATRKTGDRYVQPSKWIKLHDYKDGSWWPEWHQWLASHSGKKAAPPKMGKAIAGAPGSYVHEL
jgi:polyhydroxyalkanoate synthase